MVVLRHELDSIISEIFSNRFCLAVGFFGLLLVLVGLGVFLGKSSISLPILPSPKAAAPSALRAVTAPPQGLAAGGGGAAPRKGGKGSAQAHGEAGAMAPCVWERGGCPGV